jgi:hypothetical protein
MAADAAGFQSALMIANRIGREAEENARVVADASGTAAATITQKMQPSKPGRAPAPSEASATR